MNTNNIKVIISREYSTRVKKKSFLITTFLVPILFAAICVLPSVLMLSVKEKVQTVAVVDQSGIVMPFLENNKTATYEDMSSQDAEKLKADFASLGKDVLLIVSPLDSATRNVSMSAISKKPIGVDFAESLERRAEKAVEAYRIESYKIEGLGQIMKDVKADVKLTQYKKDDSGKETLTESGVYMMVSMGLGMIIYMFIALFGAMVMTSVIEEKSSRVVEVLISSVKATELMFGKILGVALVALTQFFLWIALTIVLVLGAGAIFGTDMFTAASQPGGVMDPSMMAGVDMSAMQSPSGMTAIFSALQDLPYVKLITCFVVFFILGYLMYASMYAAVGSAVENEGDANQLQLPVTIPLMLGFFIVFMAFRNPDSPLVFWASMFPLTSPIVMLARIPFGVPAWEIIVSIVVLLLSFMALAWLSAKIYNVGILMFGKKSSFKDLLKWLKQ